ncbi:hypothetical protein QBC45DRAFT_417770 [Copromyces sp. CBS 386.78]|nr:hypothetical protein QBC45DRAFT_417770 [Copromyces sp. CBS 386.78]
MYLTGIFSILAVYVGWTVCARRCLLRTRTPVAAKFSLFWIYAYSPAYNLCVSTLLHFVGKIISAESVHCLYKKKVLKRNSTYDHRW